MDCYRHTSSRLVLFAAVPSTGRAWGGESVDWLFGAPSFVSSVLCEDGLLVGCSTVRLRDLHALPISTLDFDKSSDQNIDAIPASPVHSLIVSCVS